MINIKTAFALLALGGNAFAHQPSAKTELICTTEYGRSSVRHVSTHTSTQTKDCTFTELITSTPVVTVRPPPKTRTIHNTKTVVVRSTASIVTDVATITTTSKTIMRLVYHTRLIINRYNRRVINKYCYHNKHLHGCIINHRHSNLHSAYTRWIHPCSG